jgi:DNA (cytosine-5)-methyltransferase 1
VLGRTDVLGIEFDEVACRTGRAAGHERLLGDVAALDPRTFGSIEGLIASPPCPSWSTAGPTSASDLDVVLRAIRTGIDRDALREACDDERSALVVEPLRWAAHTQPAWIALEQVVTALPVWQAMANELEADGYRCWTGTLDAADFGVPQNRQRAILIAARDVRPLPPEPTHAEHDTLLGAAPWVSCAAALGLPAGGRIVTGQNSMKGGKRTEPYVRSADRPAGTLTTKAAQQWRIEYDGWHAKVSPTGAARLQGFPDGYPFEGTLEERLRQIGNAVPPPLAAAVLSSVIPTEMEAVA